MFAVSKFSKALHIFGMNLSVYQISIMASSILGCIGAMWMFTNLKFPKTAFSSLILSLAITDMGTSMYVFVSMLLGSEELPTTDKYFNYIFLDTGFFIAISIAILALKIVKYGYSVESFTWIKIMLLCVIPPIFFLVLHMLRVPDSLLQLLHCIFLSVGFIILLLAYVSTMVELEAQKAIRQISFEKGNVASRLMMRLLMCFGILHIMFYLPHISLLWIEYVCERLLHMYKLDSAFYLYEWVAVSCKGFFHALAICFVLLLKPSKSVKVIMVESSIDTMSSDTVVLPPKAFRIERFTKNQKQPQYLAPLPPVSPTTSDTIID
jgi:heme/copper-type cytochrome/quinol oxidase subunit 4